MDNHSILKIFISNDVFRKLGSSFAHTQDQNAHVEIFFKSGFLQSFADVSIGKLGWGVVLFFEVFFYLGSEECAAGFEVFEFV